MSRALQPRCPAAVDFTEGVTPSQCGVVCGVMATDAEFRDQILTGGEGNVFKSLRTDPSTLLNHCCGTALPIVAPTVSAVEVMAGVPVPLDDVPSRHAHYTNCLVWQLHRERVWQGKRDDLGLDSPRPVATAPDPVVRVGPAEMTDAEADYWTVD